MATSNWVLQTYSKLKEMAFVLVLLALLLFVANIFEKEQMERMDQSFLSIYEDRRLVLILPLFLKSAKTCTGKENCSKRASSPCMHPLQVVRQASIPATGTFINS